MNDGFVNENIIVEYLNGKLFHSLNSNFQSFLRFIFDSQLSDDTIVCSQKHNKSGEKPDITIGVQTKASIKYVSIKKGSGNSVHQENLQDFTEFLYSIGIDASIIELLKRFHWSDGTDDNTGLVREPSAVYKSAHLNDLEILNSALNSADVLSKLIDRTLFQGKSPNYTTAEYIYHGTLSKGTWASRDEILAYCTNNSFKKSGVHFGPLTYQIWNANINRRVDMEPRRKSMQVKWGSMNDDLKAISSGRLK